MDAFKNFLILLTFISYPFLGCMEEKVELLVVKEGYGTLDSKTKLLSEIYKIICAYKNECENALPVEDDLKNLRPRLTRIKGILDNLLNNPHEFEGLSVDSLNKTASDLAMISGNTNIAFNLDVLENVIEGLSPKQQSKLRKLCYRNRYSIACVSTTTFLLMILFIYFACCSYYGDHGICHVNEPNANSTDYDPCAYDPCDTGSGVFH